MKDLEILQEIGMQDAPEELQKQTLQNITNTVELRMSGLTEDLLTEEQLEQFNKLEESGTSKEEMFTWLGGIVGNLQDLYDAILQEYLVELKEQVADSLKGIDPPEESDSGKE